MEFVDVNVDERFETSDVDNEKEKRFIVHEEQVRRKR